MRLGKFWNITLLSDEQHRGVFEFNQRCQRLGGSWNTLRRWWICHGDDPWLHLQVDEGSMWHQRSRHDSMSLSLSAFFGICYEYLSCNQPRVVEKVFPKERPHSIWKRYIYKTDVRGGGWRRSRKPHPTIYHHRVNKTKFNWSFLVQRLKLDEKRAFLVPPPAQEPPVSKKQKVVVK